MSARDLSPSTCAATPERAATHTPGPWSLKGCGIYAPDGWLISATGDDEAPHNDGDTQEANARLIASAPDLLASLRNMCSALNAARDPECAEIFAVKITKTHERALAVIAKATGGAS